MRSTSPPKSACPGVSTMLNAISLSSIAYLKLVTLLRIVIPRSCGSRLNQRCWWWHSSDLLQVVHIHGSLTKIVEATLLKQTIY